MADRGERNGGPAPASHRNECHHCRSLILYSDSLIVQHVCRHYMELAFELKGCISTQMRGTCACGTGA